MDFLGIGPLEVIFILLIALIIFGPKDIVKAGQATGKFLRKIIKSPGWQSVQKTSSDLRNLPNKLIREAGLEEAQEEINQIGKLAKPPDLKKELKKEFDQVEKAFKLLGKWWHASDSKAGMAKIPENQVKRWLTEQKELKKEFDPVETGLSAWTSKDFLSTEVEKNKIDSDTSSEAGLEEGS